MQKVYNRVYWENEPSHNTPLSESNLNKLDYALDVVDTRVVELGGYEERAEESADSANASAIEVRELKRQVQALVDTVKEITATATTLNPGSSATASFDSDTGVLSLGIPKGDSGITAPVNGMYTMYVDEDGNLWLVTNGEQGSEYWWQYNPTTGELYYRTPGEYVEKTIVGDVIVEITDGVEGFPIKSLVAEITPVQSGSGDPSPTNIRPISGRTGMTVTRAGKNLLDDSIKTAQSTATVVIGQTSTTEFDIFLPAGTYTASFASEKNPSINYRLSTESSGAHSVISYGNRTGTFTLTEPSYLRMWAYLSGGIVPSDITWFQLEAGSTATPYTPYTATTYPITWESIAGTVYGGTLDVVSGVLTVDKTIVDISTLAWVTHNTYGFYSNRIQSTVKRPSANSIPFDGISSIYKTVTLNQEQTTDYSVAVDSSGMLYIKDSRYSTAAEFIAASSGVAICYPLATPRTYQLTSAEIAYIETMNGINILYTDAGSIDEVTYIVESYEED